VDWVISNCVINLSPDKPSVFAEIARVLRPGGRMSVSDIVVEELPAWARASKDVYSSCVGGAISEGDYVAGLEAAGLAEVEVVERLVYEASQLAALIRSEVSETGSIAKAAGRSFDEAAAELAGKIWSAKFVARKPIS
jgi:SAM-dependent methyltransferase